MLCSNQNQERKCCWIDVFVDNNVSLCSCWSGMARQFHNVPPKLAQSLSERLIYLMITVSIKIANNWMINNADAINILKYKEYVVYHKDMKMKCVLVKNLEKRSESCPMTYFTILVNHLCNCNLLEDQRIVIIIIIIYGICNAPLPKDTKHRKQYNNKNKQNRLRIKVSFKMRLEYGDRRSTVDVYGDGVPFQRSSHWKGSVTGTFVASGNPEVETVVNACFNWAFA